MAKEKSVLTVLTSRVLLTEVNVMLVVSVRTTRMRYIFVSVGRTKGNLIHEFDWRFKCGTQIKFWTARSFLNGVIIFVVFRFFTTIFVTVLITTIANTESTIALVIVELFSY